MDDVDEGRRLDLGLLGQLEGLGHGAEHQALARQSPLGHRHGKLDLGGLAAPQLHLLLVQEGVPATQVAGDLHAYLGRSNHVPVVRELELEVVGPAGVYPFFGYIHLPDEVEDGRDQRPQYHVGGRLGLVHVVGLDRDGGVVVRLGVLGAEHVDGQVRALLRVQVHDALVVQVGTCDLVVPTLGGAHEADDLDPLGHVPDVRDEQVIAHALAGVHRRHRVAACQRHVVCDDDEGDERYHVVLLRVPPGLGRYVDVGVVALGGEHRGADGHLEGLRGFSLQLAVGVVQLHRPSLGDVVGVDVDVVLVGDASGVLELEGQHLGLVGVEVEHGL